MTSHSKSTPQVHQIKAIFEGFRHAVRPEHTPRGRSHNSQHSADDMKSRTEQSEQALLTPGHPNAIVESIETVIDTPPTPQQQQHNRPKLNSKPSWVGPLPRSRAPSPHSSMPSKVTISYEAPGLLPPVYITTTLSDPQWEVVEMEASKQQQGYIFHMDFDAIEGEHQYKFRLGPGDWWVCDESKHTIEDIDGNRNNVIYVKSGQAHQEAPQKKDSVVEATSNTASQANQPEHTGVISQPEEHAKSTLPSRDSVLDMTATRDHGVVQDDNEHDHSTDEPVPLLKHERSYPGQVEDVVPGTTLSPTSSFSSRSSEELVCPEPDPEDTSLHEFPTDHAGILMEIQRAQRNLPEDDSSGEPTMSPLSRSGSAISTLTTSPLPSLQEEEPEILMMISDSEDTSPVAAPSRTDKQRTFNHSHGPAHHHHRHEHGHPQVAKVDMEEENAINTKELIHKRNNLADLGEIFFGVVFAAVVAVVAFVMYSTGMIGQQDVVKDGGAALGS